MHRILTLLIIGFIVYTLYQENTGGLISVMPDPEEVKNVEAHPINGSLPAQNHRSPVKAPTEDYKSKSFIERILTNSMSQYLQTDNGQKIAERLINSNNSHPPVKYSIINTVNSPKRKYDIIPILEGIGETTICGEKVEINYKIIDSQQKVIADSTEQFVIGQHKIPELNVLSIGMKQNEIISGKYLSDNTSGKKSRIQITLNDIFTHLEFAIQKVKIFDDYFSENSAVTCYSHIKFNLDVFTTNGKLLNRHKLTYHVGNSNYPQVLSYILVNKPNVGVRTVIMPGKYLAHHTNNLIDLDIVKDEYVLLEISEVTTIPHQ